MKIHINKKFAFICAVCLTICSCSIQSEGYKTVKGRYSRDIVIAASNSTKADKKVANFVCDGINDEETINKAIEMLTLGGNIRLLDGVYNIDAFPNEGNSAIFFGYNEGNPRTTNIFGSTENKSWSSTHGVILHVSEKAIANMDDKSTYRVIYGTVNVPKLKISISKVNNTNFQNFYIMLANTTKKIIGIDCRGFGNCRLSQIGVFSDQYFEERYCHLDPHNPVEGCIGVYSSSSSNDEMSRLGFDTVCVGGLYIGAYMEGIDHLILNTCTMSRCVYGYVFKGTMWKTLTMINCADEGNTHLPKFIGTGHLTNIDFNIERFNAAYIPEDVTGDTNPYATESKPGGWHGFISYTHQGSAYDMKGFWKEGSGINFKTIDLNTSANTWF